MFKLIPDVVNTSGVLAATFEVSTAFVVVKHTPACVNFSKQLMSVGFPSVYSRRNCLCASVSLGNFHEKCRSTKFISFNEKKSQWLIYLKNIRNIIEACRHSLLNSRDNEIGIL